MEEVVFPRKEHTNSLVSTKRSALKMYIEIILYEQSRLHQKHMHVVMINEKNAIHFKISKGVGR